MIFRRLRKYPRFIMRTAFVCAVCMMLGGCTTTSLLSTLRLGINGPSHLLINEAIVEALFRSIPANELYVEDGQIYLDLYCEISEGETCYRMPHAAIEQHTIPDISLRGTANSIGREHTDRLFINAFWGNPWTYVEHAEHNAVRVRCARAEQGVSPIQCIVGFGRGWEPALVFPLL